MGKFGSPPAPGVASGRAAFTLTELMVVVGLIAILVSLLFPVVAKVRMAASAARCSSNLRQMGVAWSMYVSESRGRAPEYVWTTPEIPDLAWHAYWPGILEQHGVRDGVLICPVATEPIPELARDGYGDAIHDWSGKYTSNGCVIRFSAALYREGSYGYNRYLTVGNFAGNAACITALQEQCRTPLFMDCNWADTMPLNGSDISPASPPPDLTGSHDTPGSPQHWKFLIARHGRGINVCMADSSVSWVPLEEMYTLSWRNGWQKYRLTLPGT